MPKQIETKTLRQKTLLDLLANESLSSQEEVVRRMKESGFNATQPSISRDFRELGIVKLGGQYLAVDSKEASQSLPPETAVNPWALIEELMPAGPHLLVAKTKIGAASLIATQLDNAGLRDIVGTIAGDDTIFVAVPGEAAQRRIEHRLRVFGALI